MHIKAYWRIASTKVPTSGVAAITAAEGDLPVAQTCNHSTLASNRFCSVRSWNCQGPQRHLRKHRRLQRDSACRASTSSRGSMGQTV